MSEAVACSTDQHLLGEGARWDARRDELLRVDIVAGRVNRDRVADDGALVPVRTYQVPGTMGAIAPVRADDLQRAGLESRRRRDVPRGHGPGVVHAFTFDAGRGTISDGRVLITAPEEVGGPDGLTVDADGDLWVAIFGGGRVHRSSPDGALRQALSVPAMESTSCAFAGPGLHRLYVTTATEDWSDERRRAEPTAGLS
jgi:sugar lactone lactonase YvrE